MPVPKMARTPRPATSAIASTRPRRRPATGPARPPGPPDLVAPRSMMGNAAVAALLGGQQLGAEPGPSMWTGPSMLAGQDLVGNQAIANGATREPVKVPAGALPLTGPEKPKPDDARPGTPKAIPPPATKPEPQDQKDKPPAERPGKEPKKTKTGPPRSPAADPKFQALKKDVDAKKRKVGASHPPPAVEAGSAQGAAEPPPDDQEARGKVAHADEMDAAEPKTFDKKTFVDAVKKAIADRAPKNLEEADEFGDSGKAEEVKAEVQDKVGEGKDASSKEIAATTAEAPKPAPDAKTVVPMAPDQVPGKPGAPNPNQAAPDALPAEDTDMTAGPEQVGDQMAAAQVTEKQLSFENSREPSFGKAVQDKKAMDTHSAQAPSRLRKSEAREIKEVKTTAAGTGATAMTGLHATRVTTGKKVGTGKKGAKGRDEEKRLHVTAILQKVFDQTKCDVEKILSNLDKAVDRQFTAGEKAARNRFTAEHEEGMRRYKAERYGGWDGPFLWAKDKFMDLPEEANRIYERARDNYLAAMEQVITGIAGTVERELNRAKERIATGRTDLKKAVDKLPADLKAIGREAASEFEGKFDELKDTVNDKGTELVDTLATKYTDAVKSVDAEIAVEKEKNKGLVTKAAEAIGDAIETIKELGRMLMNVLRKAVSAIGLILRDPIGFLGRLITGVGGGLKLFMKSAGRHLQQGVLAWLLGSGATAGLQLPTSFDVLGILVMIAAMLGLSWPNIRTRLARKVNPKTMAAAEAGKDAIPIVVEANKRGVAGLWSDLKSRVGDLKKDLISKLASYLLPTIILAGITWIISLFNPASAFIRACKMIIDIIRFIVTQARQIFEFINAVLDAVIAIARGGTGGVPTLIERALARSIPVLIGALAAILGVGGIAGKVKQIFQQISRPVNRAIDWVINKITGLLKKLWNKIKPKRKRTDKRRKPEYKDKPHRPRRQRRPSRSKRQRKPKKPLRPMDHKRRDPGMREDERRARAADLLLPSKPFTTRDGERHKVLFTGRGPTAELTVRSVEQRIKEFFKAWDAEVKKIPDASPEKMKQVKALAAAIAKSQDVAKRKKTLGRYGIPGAPRQKAYDALVADMVTLASLLAARSPKPPLPPPVLPPFSDGVLATGFKVQYLPPDIQSIHPGEDSDVNKGVTLRGWSYVCLHNLNPKNTTAWVKMHLLPRPLGGKATDSNLVVARAPTNTTFHSNVENPAAQALSGGQEDMIWYEVDVNTHTNPDGFLENITVQWAGYEVKDSAWQPKTADPSKKQVLSSGSQTGPSGPNPLMLNLVTDYGWIGLSNVIFGSKSERAFSELVIKELYDARGPYTDTLNLGIRLMAANRRRRSAIGGIKEKIDTLVEAIKARRIQL